MFSSRPNNDPYSDIKAAIWLYFWLLIWEGVLRKWVLPGLSDLIFVIRDPVALLIYFLAFRARVFPWRPAIAAVLIMAALALAFSFADDTRFAVTLFGLRTDFLHLPLIFIMAAVMNRSDVIRFGRWILICSVPILFLMYNQFNAPKDALVNVGAGGVTSAQLIAAGGRIRPAGPFSFISGPILYFTLVAAFVFYGWFQPGIYNRILLIVATLTTIISIPVSLSRSLFLSVIIVTSFAVAVIVKDPKRIPRFLGPLIATVGFLVFAADSIYVQTFEMRWEDAATTGVDPGVYNSTLGRYLQQLMEPFSSAIQAPLFGYGIGLGTIGGGHLSTGGYTFLLAESELTRCVLELGPIVGFAFIAWRAWLSLKLVGGGWKTFMDEGDTLAWLIAGAAFLNVLDGQWGPATDLGFAIFGAGLALAAMNRPEADAEAGTEAEDLMADPELFSALKVLLIANYPADGVESMRRFGDLVSREMKNLGIEVEMLAPRVRWGRLLGPYRYTGLPKWLGYVDKHVIFPRELARAAGKAARLGSTVAHIVDHGNAMYVPPRREIPWIVTCHDLLAVRAMRGEDTRMNPTWAGRWQQRWILAGLQRADHVACVSAATRLDLLKICPEYPDRKSSVVADGLNHDYRKIPAATAWERLNAAGLGKLAERPFLLHVGSNQARKNRPGVVRVAGRLQGKRDFGLVLAGPEPDPGVMSLAASLGVAPGLTAVVKPSNDILEALYNAAHALLFPSFFEGFGWPVAEAQACGCPVICSDTSSLPEVAGKGACLHDPSDVAGMADSAIRLFDPAFRAELIRLGFDNARRFEPATMARAYAAIYSALLKNDGHSRAA